MGFLLEVFSSLFPYLKIYFLNIFLKYFSKKIYLTSWENISSKIFLKEFVHIIKAERPDPGREDEISIKFYFLV